MRYSNGGRLHPRLVLRSRGASMLASRRTRTKAVPRHQIAHGFDQIRRREHDWDYNLSMHLLRSIAIICVEERIIESASRHTAPVDRFVDFLGTEFHCYSDKESSPYY